jgi:hypothetical protein
MVEKPQGALVTLLVVHQDDADAIAMLDLLEEQVRQGDVVEHLTLAVDAATGPDAALWRAHRAGAESSEDDPLLFQRLSDIGRIERLRVVGITTLATHDPAAELDRALLALTSTVARLLGADRRRTHARLAVLGYGEPMTPAVFFSTLADVNAAVLPYDRLEDASIARPVERSSAGLFRTHGAVEIASACGLWRTMEAAPIDELRGSTSGGTVPRVRFIQSRVRLLRTPPLPVSELVAERREIPIPDGYLPATDAERLMPRLADLLLPPELTYEPAPEPRYDSQEISAGALAGILGREILHSLIELPAFLWRSVGGEVSTLTRRVLQQAIGTSSRFQVSGVDGAGAHGVLLDGDGRPVDIETVVAEPEVLAHFDPIPGEIWTTLVAEVLGSIDGDPDCRELREQAFGDARFLPVDRPLVLGGLGELPPRLVALLEPRVRRAVASLEDIAQETEDGEADEGPTAEAADEQEEVLPEPPPIVQVIAEDRETSALIAQRWSRITEVAGGLWKGARATYQVFTPVALAGGILTIRLKERAPSGEFHHKRAGSVNFVDALLRAIPQVLDRPVTVQAVQPLATIADWEPMLHDVLLAEFLAVDAESGQLDALLELAALLDVPTDAPPLRHEAITADDLDRLSAFVRSEKQATFLRDYAVSLRELAADPPTYAPPPAGAPIAGIAPPPGATPGSGALPAPSGIPFLDIPPPADDADDEEDDWDLDDELDGADPIGGSWGLLVGVREQIRLQREAAERDVERILGHLRSTKASGGVERTPVSPAVPVGAGLGLVLLLVWFGQTELGVRLISSLGLTEVRRDMLFTVMTLILVIGAAVLTDLGKGLSGQARTIILAGTSVLVTSGVLLSFENVRGLVPAGMRQSNAFAFGLGAVAVALVLLALLQSLASGDPVRIQGSRILILGLVFYAVSGLIVWQVQSRAGLVALDDAESSRVGGVLLSTALALLIASIAVLSVVRFREARRRDDVGVRERWAVEHIGLAVDARERLRSAERQWVVSMIAIAQVLRQPFGPVPEVAAEDLDEEGDAEDVRRQTALKAASVRVRLTDRGRSDLESRIRQMLVGPSWLRRRYQAMIDAHHRILATRLGVPVRNLADRRPEADPTVPSEIDLRGARGRGDRMEFVRLAAAGMFDANLAQAIEDLDVRTVFEPMLAEPESHTLDGFETRASTVDQYFQQLLPENEPTLPNDVVTTVLAAHDRRRHLQSFVWWPTMLPEPVITGDVGEDARRASTGMFRHGTVGGAGLVAVRVDVSQEFPFTEVANVAASSTASRADVAAAEGAADYGSDVGL